jgi:hypothetical protein
VRVRRIRKERVETDVSTKSSSWASNNLAEGLPITLFLTLLRVETLTVWTVIVWSEAGGEADDYQRTTRTPPATTALIRNASFTA